MDFNGWTNIEDLLKACGYSNSSENSDTPGCNDIPNGFQTLPPELVVIIGELLGNIIAGSIPYNVQNIIGNWLELVGQVILTFNAQQQYFQSGPGRYYDHKNYNIDNSFCTNNSNESTNSNNQSSKKSSKSKNTDKDKIKKLEEQIDELTSEINKIKILLKKD